MLNILAEVPTEFRYFKYYINFVKHSINNLHGSCRRAIYSSLCRIRLFQEELDWREGSGCSVGTVEIITLASADH